MHHDLVRLYAAELAVGLPADQRRSRDHLGPGPPEAKVDAAVAALRGINPTRDE